MVRIEWLFYIITLSEDESLSLPNTIVENNKNNSTTMIKLGKLIKNK